jgi:hypothetical protein
MLVFLVVVTSGRPIPLVAEGARDDVSGESVV